MGPLPDHPTHHGTHAPSPVRRRRLWLLVAAALIVLPDLSHACAIELRVITYNVFLRAPAWLFRNDHDTRTAHIPAALTDHDVIVLQEAFSNTHRDRITAALAATHPHRTMPLGGDDWRSFNGGVYLFSRWPIEHTDFLVFSECSGPDCLVKKGATYARVATPAGPAHVFGLHLQAERAASEIRAAQLR